MTTHTNDGGLKRKICFVMDCSGSMYRFNGLDGRLNRMLDATCLILETMASHLDRYDYSILGHSGETAKVEFVPFGKPPENRGEYLKILQRMLAHTQFCMAGDHTIEATDAAIDHVQSLMGSSAEADGNNDFAEKAFVVVLSDANFRPIAWIPVGGARR